MEEFISTGKLWKRAGTNEKGAWFFVTLEKDIGDKLKALFYATALKKSMSIKVMARIGRVSWQTSIFPTKDGQCFLPIKASIRKELGLKEGDVVSVVLELL